MVVVFPVEEAFIQLADDLSEQLNRFRHSTFYGPCDNNGLNILRNDTCVAKCDAVVTLALKMVSNPLRLN